MQTPDARNPAGGRGFARVQAHSDELPAKHTAGAPLALLLSRLERVRRCGHGFRADCPRGHRSRGTLALHEAANGSVLLRCHAGCEPVEVLQALGLELADLYPERIAPATPEQRREARMRAREAEWSAALGMLAFEGRILALAASELIHCRPLAWADLQRVAVAAERIEACRDRLAPPRPWRPGAKA